jgi:hypothetical protein
METLSTQSDSTLSTPDVEPSPRESGPVRPTTETSNDQVKLSSVTDGNSPRRVDSVRQKNDSFTRNRSGFSFRNAEITIRDASSVAMSECTKPDPPSVIDHIIIDEYNHDDDVEDERKDDGKEPSLFKKVDSSLNFEVIVPSNAGGQIDRNRLLKKISSIDSNSNLSEIHKSQLSSREDKATMIAPFADSDMTQSLKIPVLARDPSAIEVLLNKTESSKLNQAMLVDSSEPNPTSNDSVITRQLEPRAMHSDVMLDDKDRKNFYSDTYRLSAIANDMADDILVVPQDRNEATNGTPLVSIGERVEIGSDRRATRSKKTLEIHPAMIKGSYTTPRSALLGSNPTKRKIILRLEEEIRNHQKQKGQQGFHNSFLGHIRRRSSGMMMFGSSPLIPSIDDLPEDESHVPRGKITVSWYEGTSSFELQEHVRRCILRKIVKSNDQDTIELEDFRILDDDSDPAEGKTALDTVVNAFFDFPNTPSTYVSSLQKSFFRLSYRTDRNSLVASSFVTVPREKMVLVHRFLNTHLCDLHFHLELDKVQASRKRFSVVSVRSN